MTPVPPPPGPTPVTEIPRLPPPPRPAPPAPTQTAGVPFDPAALYDPTTFNGAPGSRRARRRPSPLAKALAAVVVLGVLGAVGLLVLAVEQSLAERRLPDVTATPDFRSSEFREVTVTRDATSGEYLTSTTRTRTDSVDGSVAVIAEGHDVISWRGHRTHWFFEEDDGSWVRAANDPDDDRILEHLLSVGDGLTLDEVLPPSTRRYVDVVDAERTTLLGDDVRHFTLRVDAGRLGDDRVAWNDFTSFWGEEEPPTGAEPDLANVEVWVTDEGLVHRVRSMSDFDDDSYTLTFVSTSEDEPFSPGWPTDYVDL